MNACVCVSTRHYNEKAGSEGQEPLRAAHSAAQS